MNYRHYSYMCMLSKSSHSLWDCVGRLTRGLVPKLVVTTPWGFTYTDGPVFRKAFVTLQLFATVIFWNISGGRKMTLDVGAPLSPNKQTIE